MYTSVVHFYSIRQDIFKGSGEAKTESTWPEVNMAMKRKEGKKTTKKPKTHIYIMYI